LDFKYLTLFGLRWDLD